MGLYLYLQNGHMLSGSPEKCHSCCCLVPCCRWACQEAWSGTHGVSVEFLDKQRNKWDVYKTTIIVDLIYKYRSM